MYFMGILRYFVVFVLVVLGGLAQLSLAVSLPAVLLSRSSCSRCPRFLRVHFGPCSSASRRSGVHIRGNLAAYVYVDRCRRPRLWLRVLPRLLLPGPRFAETWSIHVRHVRVEGLAGAMAGARLIYPLPAHYSWVLSSYLLGLSFLIVRDNTYVC